MTTFPSNRKKKSIATVLAAAAVLAAPLIWVARAQPPVSGSPRVAAEPENGTPSQPRDGQDAGARQLQAKERAPRDDHPRVRREGPPGWGGGPFIPGWGARGAALRTPSPAGRAEVSTF